MADIIAGIAPRVDTHANWTALNPTLGKDSGGKSYGQIILSTGSPVGDILVWGNDETYNTAYAAGQYTMIKNGELPVAQLTWNSATDTYTNHSVDATRLYSEIKRCVVNVDGSVNYYLNATDSTLKEGGGAADLTGADGNVMVEIPAFWMKNNHVGVDKAMTHHWEIYDRPVAGSVIHPAFIRNGKQVEKRYISAYDACALDGAVYESGLNWDNNESAGQLWGDHTTTTVKFASVSGQYPAVGITRATARKMAQNLGGAWSMQDFYLTSAIQMLYLLEYGNFNSQAQIGEGNVNGSYLASSGSQSDSPHTIAGASNSIGNASSNNNVGGARPGVDWVSYRGIENFWGNCWNFVDGINILDYQVWASSNVGEYADDTSNNYNRIAEDLPTVSNYVRDVQGIGGLFLPSSVGGTSSTYITDNFYPASGNRVVLFGGSAFDGVSVGAFFCSVDSSSAIRGLFLGARLAI